MFKFMTELEHADASCCSRPRSRWSTIQRSLVLKVLLTAREEVKSRGSRHACRTARCAGPQTICLPPFSCQHTAALFVDIAHFFAVVSRRRHRRAPNPPGRSNYRRFLGDDQYCSGTSSAEAFRIGWRSVVCR